MWKTETGEFTPWWILHLVFKSAVIQEKGGRVSRCVLQIRDTLCKQLSFYFSNNRYKIIFHCFEDFTKIPSIFVSNDPSRKLKFWKWFFANYLTERICFFLSIFPSHFLRKNWFLKPGMYLKYIKGLLKIFFSAFATYYLQTTASTFHAKFKKIFFLGNSIF